MKRLSFLLLFLLGAIQAASLFTVSKTPFEQFDCSVNFTPLAGSDGITLIGVVSNDFKTGADTTSAVIATMPAPAVVGMTDTVVFRVKGGVNGQTHIIGVRVMEKVTGEIFEGQITLIVRSGR